MLKTYGTGSSSLPLPWLFQAEVGVRRPRCTMLRNKLSSAEKRTQISIFTGYSIHLRWVCLRDCWKCTSAIFTGKCPFPWGGDLGPHLTHGSSPSRVHTLYNILIGSVIFTARCYASVVLAMAVCPSVCPSITSRCSTKTAKRRITQTTLHDTPMTLVFWRQRSPRNSTGVTPYGGAKCRWGGSKSATFDQ